MTTDETLEPERYELIRATIKNAFPGPGNEISDEIVDAFIREVRRRGLPGTEALLLPTPPPPAEDPTVAITTFPLYLAQAAHDRVLAMDSTKPFNSAFVGHLPTVRVPLPQALSYTNTTLTTEIGTVDFARDHLAGSVELVGRLYAVELGYTPARVDLVTPARKLGVRFGAIAIYLGYRNESDTSPSFYILEAGLATGQAAMLYLGKTMDTTIVQPSGYLPTPFASPDNTYTGTLLVEDDQPVQLVVKSNAPNLPHYIQVTINYTQVSTSPGIWPGSLTVDAIARVAAIGQAMAVPTGMPRLFEDVMAEIGRLFLPWAEKPGSTPKSALAAQGVLAVTPRVIDTPLDSTKSYLQGTPPLTKRLLALAEELVRNFQATGVNVGVSSVSGHVVALSTDIKNELEKVLNEVAVGIEKDPAPRIALLLGGVKPQKAVSSRISLPNGAEVVAATVALHVGAGPDGSITGTGTRQTWANQLANQKVQPLTLFRPTSLNDASDTQSIETILTKALAIGCAVKAAGSGHSYSDVATTPDFFVDTHGLDQIANPEQPLTGQLSAGALRSRLPLSLTRILWPTYDPESNRALIEVEAGITIRALNTALQARDLGLMNMGGYDGQTIIGAISTSTHGSGISLTPFPDMVQSLVLATTGRWNGKTISGSVPGNGVYYYRIEPTEGITDPGKYSDPQIELIQDDDCFNSVICSMGCFGVIYSVVIEVMQMYWLAEKRYLTTLDQVMADLTPNPGNPGSVPDILLNTRNYEVLIQPYPLNWFKVVEMDPAADPASYYKYFSCIVTERNIAPRPEKLQDHTAMADWLGTLLNLLLNEEPGFTPEALNISLLTLPDNITGNSYDIYNLGLGGGIGFAAEIGFALEDSYGAYTNANFKAAIDKIHRIAQVSREQGSQYQTSPFSLRFVKQSRAHLSMMQGRNTAMIEMDMLTGTYAGEEIMYRYETSMYPLGGRPHWGLEFDFLSGNNGLLDRLYPKLSRWMSVYSQFNTLGTFNNAFTQRMGFTGLNPA
jgi:D-arabinono-1,4-lactone oxidase/FAD binding domain